MSLRHRRLAVTVPRVVAAAAVLVLAAACKGDDPVPSAATPVTTTTIAAPVATRLSELNAPTVRITDKKGKGMRNLLVRWKVTSGGGSVVNDSVRTDAQGNANSGGWNLGTTAGVQTLQATLDGVAPVTFTATAVPGPVAELTPVTTTFTQTVVNQPVVPAVAVRAADAYGNLVPGAQVVFVLAQSQGALVGETQATNAQGIATLPTWTLGTTAGTQGVRATTPTASAITVSVTARPGPVTRLLPVSASEITAVASAPVVPTVRTADQFNNGVPNVPVTWTVGANSGSVTTVNSLSDASGLATPGAWNLGAAATQTISATSPAVPGATLGFTARTVTSLYDIEIRFVGAGGTEAMRDAFRAAGVRWRTVITGDVHTLRLRSPAGDCAAWQPAVDTTVNDVLIFARIAPIDGAGRILARAGPCYFNPTNLLPIMGTMEFDEADLPALLNNGGIADVVAHEMGHVLGIGTVWNFRSGSTGLSRSLLVGAGTTDPYFTGAATRSAFAAINTVTYSGNPVPVENTGGAGTADAHWRETTFTRELMTGFYNSGAVNPLSRVTVASLQDVGYQVNFGAAEPFTLTAALYAFPFEPSAQLIPIVEDNASLPMYLYQNGRATRIR